MTVMMGGDVSQGFDVAKHSKDEIIQIAVDSVHEHLGFSEKPDDVLYNFHKQCIPQYYVST